jgi:hypothetical protein
MTILILMLIAFAAGAVAATAFLQSRLRAVSEASAELERAVVRAAMLRGGRITALDVRPPSALTLADVESQLRRLHADGYCESDLTSDGHPVYIFAEFDEAPQRALRLESEILQMARARHGLVDVSKIASETDLSYVEAREMLDRMAAQGICEPTDSSDTYRFFPTRDRAHS